MVELLVAGALYFGITASAVYVGALKALQAFFGEQKDDSYTFSPPE